MDARAPLLLWLAGGEWACKFRTARLLSRQAAETLLGCKQVKDEEGKLMNDFTGRVRREDWAPPLASSAP